MLKKITFAMFTILASSQVFAQAAMAPSSSVSEKAYKYVAYFLALGLAVYGGTQAQSKAAAVALEGIARNPAAADKIQTPMILALALMESLVIFALISTFLL